MEANVQAESLRDVKAKLNKERRALFFKRLFANRLAVVGGSIMIFITLLTFLGPLLVSYSPYEMIVEDRLQAPNAAHWLGTDEYGRDLLSRVIYGARASMGVGLAVAFIASLVGMILGLYSAYYKILDHIIMRICDGLMSFPAILLAIAIMAALGSRVENVVIALSFVYTPYVARIVRASALVIKEETYVEALISQGASSFRILFMHILPNTISPLIIQGTFIFAQAVIIEASLSFLGVGVPPPDPSWGNILYDGKFVIFNAWWMILFPGIVLSLSVLGLNLFGDGLRDLLDPHTK